MSTSQGVVLCGAVVLFGVFGVPDFVLAADATPTSHASARPETLKSLAARVDALTAKLDALSSRETADLTALKGDLTAKVDLLVNASRGHAALRSGVGISSAQAPGARVVIGALTNPNFAIIFGTEDNQPRAWMIRNGGTLLIARGSLTNLCQFLLYNDGVSQQGECQRFTFVVGRDGD